MFFCEKCQNTGGTEPGGDLDCTAPGCDAAVKRAEFNTWLLQMGWPDGRMKEWQIYRHGQREAQEEIAELKSRLNVADLRINAAIRAKLETEQRLFEVTQAAAEAPSASAAQVPTTDDLTHKFTLDTIVCGMIHDGDRLEAWRANLDKYIHVERNRAAQVAVPDYSELSREALERHAARMAQALADDKARQFYEKYATGPMLAPSCLCCGQLPVDVAIRHAEIPGMVICKQCRDAATPSPAKPAPVADAAQGDALSQQADDQHTAELVTAFEQGRAAGIEEAAKITEPDPTLRVDELTAYGMDRRRMAASIRALAAKPWITDYDADKHSGYLAPPAAVQPNSESAADVRKALFWFDCLHKCAKMLELSDDTPIPSGVVAAVEKLTAAPAQPGSGKHDVESRLRHVLGERAVANMRAGMNINLTFAQAAGLMAQPDSEEDAYVIDRMGKLLAGVAVALKGPEAALHRHGYQDLPELAEKAMLELELHRLKERDSGRDAALRECATLCEAEAADCACTGEQYGQGAAIRCAIGIRAMITAAPQKKEG